MSTEKKNPFKVTIFYTLRYKNIMKKMSLHAAQQCTITKKLVDAKDAMLEGKLSLHSQLGIYYDGFSYGP